MREIVIIGSGFSALISYYFYKKFDVQVISANNSNFNYNHYKHRKNLDINKFYSSKSKSMGNLSYYINKSFKIHDRLSFGGNTNIWGGFINIKDIPHKVYNLLAKDNIKFEKLDLNKNGYKSNIDTIGN